MVERPPADRTADRTPDRTVSGPVPVASILRVGLYLTLVTLSLLQQPGRTTNDTRLELTEDPGGFLRGAFGLWHPEVTLGEIQNQAYGYLFPQGPFFLLADLAQMPAWLTQRVWTALVLLVAAEGARRVALRVGLAPAAALVVAAGFALSPRMLGTVGVISAESLPGAVMPWALLPIIMALQGALAARRAAVLSAAAVACMGGVNAVEVIGSLPVVLVFLLWGVRRGLARWSLVGWWTGLVVLACSWWILPLVLLGRYSPPFFDYVESADSTTGLLGWLEAVRGSTHWVSYVVVRGEAWWPAAHAYAVTDWLVLVTAVLAGLGLLGLARMADPWQVPFVVALVVGLVALTIGHGTWAGSPLAGVMRDLLDGPLAPFRNVHKIDPVVRLPLAIGLGVLVQGLAARVPTAPPARGVGSAHRGAGAVGRGVVVRSLVVGGLLVALLQPWVLNQGRTDGWRAVPGSWDAATDLIRERQGEGADRTATWVVPGAGFAIQTWGRTMDEPLRAHPDIAWVSRSQIPLAPGPTIRALDGLESLLASGSGSPALGETLARMGIGHVLLRRDLDRGRAESPDPAYAARALSESGGLRPVATFGQDLELFAVTAVRPHVRLTDLESVSTLRGAPEDVVVGVANGTVPRAPVVLTGEDGWDAPADVVTDGAQRRERSFGRVFDAEGPVLAAGEEYVGSRSVPDYPLAPGTELVTAAYDGASRVTASSSQGFVNVLGAVLPEVGPYSAVDDATSSSWVSSVAEDPVGQWWQVEFPEDRPVGRVRVTTKVGDPAIVPVARLRVEAGGRAETASVNPVTGAVTVDLDVEAARTLRVTAVGVTGGASSGPVAVSDVRIDGEPIGRSLVVPPVEADASASYLLSTRAEPRACLPVPVGLSCDVRRERGAEEAAGLDRTLDLARTGAYELTGEVVARARAGTGLLLDPLGDSQVVRASTTLGLDPAVGPRSAYDGDPRTSWLSEPGDPAPSLTVGWSRPRTIRGVTVEANGLGERTPRTLTLTSADGSRTVDLTEGSGRIRPLTTRQVRVTFEGARDRAGVGVTELDLVGVRAFVREVDRSDPTGAVCGLGPEVVIDGVVTPTRVDGTLGDVLDGDPLTLTACGEAEDGRTRSLSQGDTRIRAVPTDQFQVTRLRLGDPAVPTGSARGDLRAVVGTWTDDRRTVTVAEETADRDRLLSLPESYNRGWTATVAGTTLDPVRVDGWQQGFLLPAGEAGVVELTYTPQRLYAAVLVAGLVAGALVLLLALVLLVRGPGQVPPATDRPLRHHRGMSTPVRAAVVVETLVLAGPVLVLGLALQPVLERLRTGVAAYVGAAAVPLSAVLLTVRPGWEVPAQALCAVGLGILGGVVLWRRPTEGAAR